MVLEDYIKISHQSGGYLDTKITLDMLALVAAPVMSHA